MGEKTQQVAGNGTAARPAGNQVRARKDQQQRAGGADDDTGEVSFCARYSVIGSRRYNAAMIITKIGVVVVTTLASIGEVLDTPST